MLWRIAEIVYEADVGDERVMELTGTVFDGLYEYYRRATLLGRDPS